MRERISCASKRLFNAISAQSRGHPCLHIARCSCSLELKAFKSHFEPCLFEPTLGLSVSPQLLRPPNPYRRTSSQQLVEQAPRRQGEQAFIIIMTIIIAIITYIFHLIFFDVSFSLFPSKAMWSLEEHTAQMLDVK